VSGPQARFAARDDGLWVVDAGSTNGTFVNGERVDAPQRLERGDVVRLGETELEVQL
jgi:pSer/pThr/pTyr-binding forkhead associated (FHA) protein